MGFITSRIKRKIKTGFTLVELLIVVGILTILLTIVLIAINPLEQLHKTSDVATETVVKDYTAATKYFYASEKTNPWVKSSSCRDELSTQDTISQMPSCVSELTKGGDLQAKEISSNEAKDIYMTECSNSIALCYKPKSNAFKKNPNAIYQRNGAPNPKCPDDDNCYSCDFTTNEAKECFAIMGPNTDTLAIAESGAPNEAQPVIERPSEKVCGNVSSDEAACMADVVTDSAGNQLTTLALPNGLSPEKLHKAYNLPCVPGGTTVDWQCDTPTTFGPETVAIVGAFHNPTLESDLAVYNQTFGLPPCTKANGCLTVVNQNGQTSPLPSGQSSDWAAEAALDIQSVHAICQTCKILFVETDSNTWVNMGKGTQKAAQMGATVVSNSYGNNEVAGYHTQFDAYYDNPGVPMTASSGDWGYGSFYPASNKNVIGVGGTELYLFYDNTYASEKVWSGAGSGCSTVAGSAGSHQISLPNWSQVGCGDKKAISDVSAVASPYTGIAVHISGTWRIYGGTSLSSPIYAATIALQGGIAPGADSVSFPYAQKGKFRDVTIGSNGGCGGKSICLAGVGYDGPTGLGTPNLLPQQVITPTVFPTNTSTPTSTPISSNCTKAPTLTALTLTTGNQYYPAMPGDLIDLALSTTNNDPSTCYSVFNKSYSIPSGWQDYTVSHSYSENAVLQGGWTRGYNLLVGIPFTEAIGNFNYNFYVKKDNQSTVYPAEGAVKVVQVAPTPAHVPIGGAAQCLSYVTATLQNSLILTAPGSTVDNKLILNSSNAANCSVTYKLRFTSRPSWYFSYLPSSVTLAGGETKEIPFKITASEYNLVPGNYVYNVALTADNNTRGYTNGRVQIRQASTNNVPDSFPTPTAVPTPTSSQDCSTHQTVSITKPIISAVASQTIKNTLTIKNNNKGNCSPVEYSMSLGGPIGIITNGLINNQTLASGETKNVDFSITLPDNKLLAQNYEYEIWVSKELQTDVNPVKGIIKITQSSPTTQPTLTPTSPPISSPSATPTPTTASTPTPVSNCTTEQTVTLLQPTISAIPGATVNNTLTVKNNNSGNCSPILYAVSRGYPSGWVQNGIPNSFTLSTGETKNIEFTFALPTIGLLAQDYSYQFWVAKQGQTVLDNPANGIVRVTQASPTSVPTPTSAPTSTPIHTPTLPPNPTKPPINYDLLVPGYHIDQTKFFKNYAVFFFDNPGFAPTGSGWNMQISLKSDFPNDFTQGTTSFGIPSAYSQDAPLNDSYAALRAITSKYVGFVSLTTGYTFYENNCGKTVYWRITNFYNVNATDKKYGPTYTGVIDCTTKVGMVDPPLSWYSVFSYSNYTQKYYEPLWDFDKNGVINWTDYWLGAFSTKFRSGGWQPPE